MKNKKGVEGHVDWVISIGIFLTYLLGMFVLIKPGVIPVHDYNTLLDIIEENVKKDYDSGLYWTLYKVPLFITQYTTGECIKIKNFPYNVNQENLNVYEIVTDPITQQESLNGLNKALQGDRDTFYIQKDSFSVDGKYVIYFSYNKAYTNNGDPTSGIIDLNFDLNDCIDNSDPTKFNYNLGISEKTRGLVGDVLSQLDNLKNEQFYETLKERYGYPKSKEFSVVITKGQEVYEYKVSEPDAKTNVYTRQWSDFILKYNGKRDPVQMGIRIW